MIRKYRFQILFLSAIVMFAGCGQPQGAPTESGTNVARGKPSSAPSAMDLIKATAPQYQSAAGVLQECLGRLVFDVKMPIEWGTAYTRGADFDTAFSSNVFDQGDSLQIGNVKIAVFGPLEPDDVRRVLARAPTARMRTLEEAINKGKEFIAETRNNRDVDDRSRRQADFIARGVAEDEKSLNDLKNRFREFNVKLEGTTSYATTRDEPTDESKKYSVIGVYLRDGDHVYFFQSEEALGANMSEALHKEKIVKLLGSFRTRTMGEIPKGLGVCIPYGFLPDDGQTEINVKQSIRWPDVPGVLYTIHTGNVQAQSLKFPPVIAASRASVDVNGSVLHAGKKLFEQHRIGPRPYRIGGLTGEQGGIAFKAGVQGAEPYEAYSVFTGYSGWLGSAVLPYILVDMRSFTVEQAPELKKNPPPFAQSMNRLEALLKSIRLRQTNPPMPELSMLRK